MRGLVLLLAGGVVAAAAVAVAHAHAGPAVAAGPAPDLILGQKYLYTARFPAALSADVVARGFTDLGFQTPELLTPSADQVTWSVTATWGGADGVPQDFGDLSGVPVNAPHVFRVLGVETAR